MLADPNIVPINNWIGTIRVREWADNDKIFFIPLHQYKEKIRTLPVNKPILVIVGRDGNDAEFNNPCYNMTPSSMTILAHNNITVHPNNRPASLFFPIGMPEVIYNCMTQVVQTLNELPTRTNKVLICHHTPPQSMSHYESRHHAYEYFSNKPFATVLGETPIDKWMYQILCHRWVISPPGLGWDCDRTWQSLYLGARPILIRSVFTEEIHRRIPSVVLVNRWEDVTQEFLDKQPTNLEPSRIYLKSYWIEFIDNFKRNN